MLQYLSDWTSFCYWTSFCGISTLCFMKLSTWLAPLMPAEKSAAVKSCRKESVESLFSILLSKHLGMELLNQLILLTSYFFSFNNMLLILWESHSIYCSYSFPARNSSKNHPHLSTGQCGVFSQPTFVLPDPSPVFAAQIVFECRACPEMGSTYTRSDH